MQHHPESHPSRAVLILAAMSLLTLVLVDPLDEDLPATVSRVLLTIAVAALGLAVLRWRRAGTHPPDDLRARAIRVRGVGRDSTPAGRPGPHARRAAWRSAMAPAHLGGASSQASGASLASATDATSARPRCVPSRVIVLCDGTPAGDAACRLARRFADQVDAAVRAIALLPRAAIDGSSERGSEDGPIERFLDDVTAQLYRTAANPGLWQLTLVVHDLPGELRRICRDFDAEMVIVPTSECDDGADILHAIAAAVADTPMGDGTSAPIVCVAGQKVDRAPVELRPATPRAVVHSVAAPIDWASLEGDT